MTASHAHPSLTASERTRLGRRAQLLAGTSVSYNAVEAIIAVAAGIAAGSVALIGFGLDSVVEVSSGLIILWQFRHRLPESRERQALRLMSLSFFALAAYVTVESLRALVLGGDPEPSPVGIGLATASLIVMPFLSWAQRRTGRALGSQAVVADSTQTLLCTYLSAVLLVGLLLNATLGWGWADPIAGLIIAAVAVREGVEAWKGESCCVPGHPADTGMPLTRAAVPTPARTPAAPPRGRGRSASVDLRRPADGVGHGGRTTAGPRGSPGAQGTGPSSGCTSGALRYPACQGRRPAESGQTSCRPSTEP